MFYYTVILSISLQHLTVKRYPFLISVLAEPSELIKPPECLHGSVSFFDFLAKAFQYSIYVPSCNHLIFLTLIVSIVVQLHGFTVQVEYSFLRIITIN